MSSSTDLQWPWAETLCLDFPPVTGEYRLWSIEKEDHGAPVRGGCADAPGQVLEGFTWRGEMGSVLGAWRGMEKM